MVVSCRTGARAFRWRVNGGGALRRPRDQTLWLSLGRSRFVDGDCAMAGYLVASAFAAASSDRPSCLGRQRTLSVALPNSAGSSYTEVTAVNLAPVKLAPIYWVSSMGVVIRNCLEV